MLQSITFVTGNLDKVRQTVQYCPVPVTHTHIDLPEIQSLDVEKVLEQKAKSAYQQIEAAVLVEDTSLVFSALGKLPGTFIKWFFEELGNEGMCRLLDSYTDRSAVAQVNYGLYDGKTFQLFVGMKKGTIASSPRGTRWGWNPIFIPEGETRTWGEMTEEETHPTNIRRIALEKLATYLQTQK